MVRGVCDSGPRAEGEVSARNRAEADRLYRERHREALLERKRVYREEHREEISKEKRERYEREKSGARKLGQTTREQIDYLLSDGRRLKPGQIAQLLHADPDNIRTRVRLMLEAGEIATEGNGSYFTTDETRGRLAVRAEALRRGPTLRPVSSVAERHLQYLQRRGLRPNTIKRRRWYLSRLELWLQSQGVGILDATPELLERFTDLAHGHEGRRGLVWGVSGFYRWAVDREDLIDRNPARLLVVPTSRRGLPRPISEDRLTRALELAEEPVRTWLIIAGWCGLRCMEIAALHSNDVDLEARMLIVRDGKNGDARVQPMPPIVVGAIEQHLGRGYLFQRADPPPGPVSADHVRQVGNDFLHNVVGIPDTMHTLRHRYATKVYEHSGYDLLATQQLLGHRTIASTQIYAKARPAEQLHDVVAQF